jgi:glyoxylase I family protein
MKMRFCRVSSIGAVGLALAFCALGPASASVGPNTQLDETGMVFANVSLSVSDMERSTKFYQALGFQAGDVLQRSPQVGKLLGATTDNASLQLRFLSRNGMILELIHMDSPPTAPASKGAVNQLGLSHIGFRVDNVDRVATVIKANGGTTLDATRMKIGDPGHRLDIMFCTDPDGLKMEIASAIKD